MSYIPHTDSDRDEMLRAVGVNKVEDLVNFVPEEFRFPDLDLPPALSELEVLRYMSAAATHNRDVDHTTSFLGGGAYNHFIPSAVSRITSRNEFYTSYTPYQAEVSQGTLQSIYEFQTMVSALMGMDVANASMYDGATAAAEACLLAVHVTRRRKVVVARSFHPEWLEVLRTFTQGSGLSIEVVGDGEGLWSLSPDDLSKAVDSDTACVLVQYPNFFGSVEDVRSFARVAHESGAMLVTAVYPIALGLLKPPGELDADVAVGEGQSLGTDLNFGGPYLGLFSTRSKWTRYMPGRLVGATTDTEGNRGYVLTLQTREQHIRREKATSNICTNEALMALASTVYMSLMGKRGMRKVAQLCLNNAHYLAGGIGTLEGWSVVTPDPFFNEFVVQCPVPAVEVVNCLLGRGILAGLDLSRFYPEHADKLLVCVTEMNTRAEMDTMVAALREVEAGVATGAR